MIMDIAVLAVLVLTVFFSMRKGFAMSVVGFCKGFVSLIIAWVFCDDISAWLMESTSAGSVIAGKIGDGLSSRWESSDIYMALPDLFKESGNSAAGTLITGGSYKLAGIFLTIICFAAIIILLRVILLFVGRSLSHKYNDGFAGTMDWFLGLVLGTVLGILYVFLFLALLFPVVGLFMPSQCETVSGWLDSSFAAGDLYDNNLLLILFRDFFNFTV